MTCQETMSMPFLQIVSSPSWGCVLDSLAAGNIANSILLLLCPHSSGKLWIPASLINMSFVKPSLRVLYVNVIFFVWTIILSIMLNST